MTSILSPMGTHLCIAGTTNQDDPGHLRIARFQGIMRACESTGTTLWRVSFTPCTSSHWETSSFLVVLSEVTSPGPITVSSLLRTISQLLIACFKWWLVFAYLDGALWLITNHLISCSFIMSGLGFVCKSSWSTNEDVNFMSSIYWHSHSVVFAGSFQNVAWGDVQR